MAKQEVGQWSTTPAENTDIDSIDIDEGAYARNWNNAVRAVMAQVKTKFDSTATTISGLLTAANNLSDLASASTARTNLGLGTIATEAAADYTTVADLASTSNGEGAALVGIEDAGGIITATTVEGALAENRAAIDAIKPLLDTVEDIATTDISALHFSIGVLGYTDAPIAPANWIKSATEPATSIKEQSSDGAWWTLPDFAVDIRHFGPVVDGDDIDTALSNALDYCVNKKHGRIVIPSGEFYLETAHSATWADNRNSLSIEGSGDGNTYLIVKDSTGGFVFDNSAAGRNDINMENLTFIAQAAASGSAGKAVSVTGQGAGSSTAFTTKFKNLFFTADWDDLDTGSYFTHCVELIEVDRPYLENVRMSGRYAGASTATDWYLMQYGVYLYDCYGAFLTECRAWSAHTGFYLEMVTHEGLTMFRSGTGGKTNTGLRIVGDNRSVGDIESCYFDSFEYGIRAEDAHTLKIYDTVFWHPDGYDDDGGATPEPSNYYGIKLENIDQSIVRNTVHRFENTTPTTYGIHLGVSCQENLIEGNNVKSRDYGVYDNGEDTLIRNNEFIDCGVGVQVTASASGTPRIIGTTGNSGTTNLIVDNSGDAVISTALPYGASATLSTNQSIPNSTDTVIGFDTLLSGTTDLGGWFSAGNPATPTAGTMTVPSGLGITHVDVLVGITWGSSATGARTVKVFRNGATFALIPWETKAGTGSAQQQVFGVRIPVSDGDALTVVVNQTSGAALNVASNNATYFTVRVAN